MTTKRSLRQQESNPVERFICTGTSIPAGTTAIWARRRGGEEALAAAKIELFDLQDKFYAQADRSLLIVLQAIDAAGKDSTVKHVMSGLNPEGVDVHSFKAPSAVERSHDYLWRHQLVLPEPAGSRSSTGRTTRTSP